MDLVNRPVYNGQFGRVESAADGDRVVVKLRRDLQLRLRPANLALARLAVVPK